MTRSLQLTYAKPSKWPPLAQTKAFFPYQTIYGLTGLSLPSYLSIHQTPPSSPANYSFYCVHDKFFPKHYQGLESDTNINH